MKEACDRIPGWKWERVTQVTAEGATRPESLRQMNRIHALTLESDQKIHRRGSDAFATLNSQVKQDRGAADHHGVLPPFFLQRLSCPNRCDAADNRLRFACR